MTYTAARAKGATQAAAAASTGVPRSTHRYWVDRDARTEASEAEKTFFESPAGVAFLHRLTLALHLIIVFSVGGGIRQVISVLELAKLTAFVATSVGCQHGIAQAVEKQIVAFGKEERTRLGKAMEPKDIAVCQDETFHPATCLVAIEPVSNFILAEKYVEHRDAKTWGETMKEALEGLPVKIRQSTSDAGAAILSHVRQLKAHHASDLFHVQYETSGAMSLDLSRRTDAANEAVNAADKQLSQVDEQRAEWEATTQGPGRPPNFERRAVDAETKLIAANLALSEASTRQEDARTARRGLARDYHPVDIATGEPRTAEQVGAKLQEHLDALKAIAVNAGLPERSMAALQKAERQLPILKVSLAYFHEQVDCRVAVLKLPPEQADALKNQLIPAAYLERAANRAKLAIDKEALRSTADDRRQAGLAILVAAGLGDVELEALFNVAGECADLFQRTSSCVEGRNGQLSLRHHHLHTISADRLETMTVMHNYFIKRPDGTTAAERFFRHAPRDLLDYLLENVRPPPRPRPAKPTKPRSPSPLTRAGDFIKRLWANL